MQAKESIQFVGLLCGIVAAVFVVFLLTKKPPGAPLSELKLAAPVLKASLRPKERVAAQRAPARNAPRVSKGPLMSLPRPMPTSRPVERPLPPALQTYTSVRPKVRILRYTWRERPPFSRKDAAWTKQLPAWRAQMQSAAQTLRRAGVGKLLLVHGTFVGKDPFGVIHLLAKVVPFWKPVYTKKLVRWNEHTSNALFRDQGNWLEAHVSLLKKAFGKGVGVSRFHWSSRNDHAARLQGALRLLEVLREKSKQVKPGQRIVLWGHSHAGQLFALLTHFLCHSRWSAPLLRIGAPKKLAAIKAALAQLQRFPLVFVTMGTPPRYTWARCEGGPQLLHLVNHRGKGHLAGKGTGVLTTRAGDYVQQWGIVGSDLLSAIPSIFKANKQLAPLLGPGADPLRWYQAAKKRMRLHHRGTALLIDYKDQSRILPNFASTVMGHGVYTRLQVLLFHMELLAKHLASDAPTKPRK